MIFNKNSSLKETPQHRKERLEILQELKNAKLELKRLNEIFNFSSNNLQSDRLIFQIKAAEMKYRYFCNLAREKMSEEAKE